MLLESFLIEGITYWLGFSDFAHEGLETKSTYNFPTDISGTFRWQESHQLVEYASWGTGQPSGGSSQNCGWKTYGPSPGWHDAICSETNDGGAWGQIHALCEADK